VRAGRRSFTLIELVSTMTVLAVIGTAASVVTVEAAGGFIDASTRGTLHAELSVAVDRIVRETRSIPRDPSAAGPAPHIDLKGDSVLEWRDLDGDVYRLEESGGVLLLAVDGGPPGTLLTDVVTVKIDAQNESGTSMATSLAGAQCDPIRLLEFTLSVSRDGVVETLRTAVFVRAMMEGGGS
jgi:prepilin-type N-terminal cleavage/methylation domain-containing protein